MDGFMIRYHTRGGVHDWQSVKDASGDVRYFRYADDAHTIKESLELSHPDMSYNVYPHDAGAL